MSLSQALNQFAQNLGRYLASTSITPELTTVDQHMDQRAGPWPTWSSKPSTESLHRA